MSLSAPAWPVPDNSELSRMDQRPELSQTPRICPRSQVAAMDLPTRMAAEAKVLPPLVAGADDPMLAATTPCWLSVDTSGISC